MERTRATVEPPIAALRVELLGRFMVSRADVGVPETGWRLGKARSLVKLLALAPGCRLHREQVIDLLWPELDFEDGANNLHQVLHVARRTLGPLAPELAPTRIVRLQQQVLALEAPDGVWVDAVAFERLAAEALTAETTTAGYAAVELYHGDLLPEDLYEDWAAEPREALRQQYLAVLLRLAALHEARREGTPAIDALRRVVAAELTHEEAHVGLMRLYALTGRRQQALRQYERLRELLERELAARPDPVTDELFAAIQAGHYPAEEWPAAPPTPAARPAAPAVREPAEPFIWRSPDFVNREVELGTLHNALGRALAGSGQVVFIAGEPGIGKTRLIEELARHARAQQVAMLWGRSYHDAGAPAYWPWVQILREHLRTSAPDAITADFRAEAADLARITPELRRWFPELPEPPRLDPEQERFRLFDSMATVLTRMAARRPLLLVLDDLHWADRSSLLLLEYVAGPLSASRVLIVGAYRHIEVDRRHPLIRTLAELSRQGMTSRIDLHGFDEQAVDSFSALRAGRPAPTGLPAVIFEQTAGNPFFVKEVVQLLLDEERFDQPAEGRSWRIAIPRGIRETMALRRDRLSDNANQVLSIAAVVGRDFGLDVVSAVSARPTIEVLEGLEESLRAGLLTEVANRPGTFHFVHAIGRQTLYDELSRARRVTMHRQIGEAIEQLHTADFDTALPALAHHFYESASLDGGEKAIEFLRCAGQQAFDTVAYAESAQFVAQALDLAEHYRPHDLSERCRLLLQYGKALASAGDTREAVVAYEQAAEQARELAVTSLIAEAAIGVSDAAFLVGEVEGRYIPMLEHAIAAHGDERSLIKVHLLRAIVRDLTRATAVVEDSNVRARKFSQEALEVATEVGTPDARIIAHEASLWAYGSDVDVERRMQHTEAILELARETRDPRHLLLGHTWRVFDHMAVGDVPRSELENEAYYHIAVELREPNRIWAATFRRAMYAILRGDLGAGEAHALAALHLGERCTPEQAKEALLMQMAQIRHDQDRAGEMVDLAREMAGRHPVPSHYSIILNLLLADVGEFDEVRVALSHLKHHNFETLPRNLFWLANVALLSHVSTQVADLEAAAVLYELLAPHAGRHVSAGGNVVAYGPAAYYLGLLALELRDTISATEHLRQAVTASAHMGAHAFEAHAKFALARALLRSPTAADRRLALQLEAEVFVSAQSLGLTRLSRQVSHLLDVDTTDHTHQST